jgi:DNA polymerase I-like protein with 3'-5' exonuclease and polymerase domains
MIHSSSNLDRWLYNAQDAVATLHVKRGLLLEDKELQNILPHYYLVTNPAIRVLVEMQKVGVKVNLEYIKEAIKHEHALAEEILYALDQVFPIKFGTDKKFIHKFNPGSSDQKQTLFYDLFGIRKKYNKGAVTTNKAFLTNLKETHSNPRVAFLAEVCEKYSLAASTGSQLSMPLYNGRMHTSYTLGGVSENEDGDDLGTDTGRLASKRSYFYVKDNVKGKWVQAGANLQNRKKGHQRRILTAEEGEEFCMVDLWAAEAYLVALDAQEEKLLAMLDRGEKCHNWLEQVTKAKFPDECDAAHYTYKDAKQGIHSMNYDAQPGIIANSSRLPGYVAEWQYNFYHGEFPGIKRRMLRVKDTIQRTKSITSFLGRKILFIQSWGDELLKRAYAWRSQSTIGEMAIIAMTKLNYVGKHFEPFMFPCLNTHDGLATRVKLGNRDAVTARMADAFNIPISYLGKIIRIPVEVSWGPNFNDVEKGTTKIVKYKEDGTWELH